MLGMRSELTAIGIGIACLAGWAECMSQKPTALEQLDQMAPEMAVSAPPVVRGVDLLYQFADPSNRDQCNIGACHAFGAVAVLEAAYFRQYKETIHLSEADLFIQAHILHPDLSVGQYWQPAGQDKDKLYEGETLSGDIRYAIDHGVATSLSYLDFAKRYYCYREREQQCLRALNAQWNNSSWFDRLFDDPRASWAKLQESPEKKRLVEMLLGGEGAETKLPLERENIRMRLKDFRVLRTAYDDSKSSGSVCAMQGASQKKEILSELNSGRPVLVNMNLAGLKAWGPAVADPAKDAYHGFAIVGCKYGSDHKIVFQTRGSAGNMNPDIQEDELCRIQTINTVLAPRERR